MAVLRRHRNCRCCYYCYYDNDDDDVDDDYDYDDDDDNYDDDDDDDDDYDDDDYDDDDDDDDSALFIQFLFCSAAVLRASPSILAGVLLYHHARPRGTCSILSAAQVELILFR